MIKFRAWSKTDKRMIWWDEMSKNSHGLLRYLTRDDMYALMQYTGIKDKNGVEIYEGDVVRAWGGECHYGVWEFEKTITVNDHFGDVYELSHFEYLEVIGNVHEHPELLVVE